MVTNEQRPNLHKAKGVRQGRAPKGRTPLDSRKAFTYLCTIIGSPLTERVCVAEHFASFCCKEKNPKVLQVLEIRQKVGRLQDVSTLEVTTTLRDDFDCLDSCVVPWIYLGALQALKLTANSMCVPKGHCGCSSCILSLTQLAVSEVWLLGFSEQSILCQQPSFGRLGSEGP